MEWRAPPQCTVHWECVGEGCAVCSASCEKNADALDNARALSSNLCRLRAASAANRAHRGACRYRCAGVCGACGGRSARERAEREAHRHTRLALGGTR